MTLCRNKSPIFNKVSFPGAESLVVLSCDSKTQVVKWECFFFLFFFFFNPPADGGKKKLSSSPHLVWEWRYAIILQYRVARFPVDGSWVQLTKA